MPRCVSCFLEAFEIRETPACFTRAIPGRTFMKRFHVRIVAMLIAAFVALALSHAPTFAQSNAQPNNSQSQFAPHDDKAPASSPAATPDKTDSTAKNPSSAAISEILSELERMRNRIAELEAQLKAQSADAPADTSVTSAAALVAPVAISAAAAPVAVPLAVQTTDKKPTPAEPFAFADWTWLNGNSRTHDSPLATKYFTPEFRADVSYIYDFHHPQDHTLVGTTESGRTGEVQVQQLGIGGDFNVGNVRGRLMTQFGLYSTMTPRNDASPGVGQWDLSDAYRYISEAYGGYHFNVLHGINVDAGIFMSYIGLFSYYNADNWAYQPSYVSSNTPWFFNGVRVQIFPSEHLKIEPWFINGWQSYGRFNNRPGIGAQILWRPNGKFELLGNQYILGEDTLNVPGRVRYHTDDSIEYKYYDRPGAFVDKMAF